VSRFDVHRHHAVHMSTASVSQAAARWQENASADQGRG
jgi:hypothetical protein